MVTYLPGQSGSTERRKELAGVFAWLTGQLAALTRVAGDDMRVADSTPIECGRSHQTAKRSDLASWAEYGYCALPHR